MTTTDAVMTVTGPAPCSARSSRANTFMPICSRPRDTLQISSRHPSRSSCSARSRSAHPTDLSHAADRALLSAVGTAAAGTGAPVLIEHPGPAQIDAVLDALLASGVAPERVAVTGCGAVAPDPAAVLALADSGIFVLFDRIARLTDVYRTWDDEDVAAAIVALSTAGRAQHVLLSPGIRERIDLSRYGGGGCGVLGEYGAYLSWHGVDAELGMTTSPAFPARTRTRGCLVAGHRAHHDRQPGTRPHLPRARRLRA